MIKFAYMINRIKGMGFEEFVAYHKGHHGPLFASIPECGEHVRRYTVSHPVAAGGYPAPAFDGLTEIWFDDWAAHDAFFTSRNYKETVNPDELKFIDTASVAIMVTEETIVVDGSST